MFFLGDYTPKISIQKACFASFLKHPKSHLRVEVFRRTTVERPPLNGEHRLRASSMLESSRCHVLEKNFDTNFDTKNVFCKNKKYPIIKYVLKFVSKFFPRWTAYAIFYLSHGLYNMLVGVKQSPAALARFDASLRSASRRRICSNTASSRVSNISQNTLNDIRSHSSRIDSGSARGN